MTASVTVTGLAELRAKLDSLAGAVEGLGRAQATVGTNVPYARYVHDGTRPHDIAAVNKKALAWKGAEHPVRTVHHPGYVGNPYLTSALNDNIETIRAQFAATLQQIADGAAPASALATALYGAGLLVEAAAKERVNVRTGTLRRSITTDVSGRFRA